MKLRNRKLSKGKWNEKLQSSTQHKNKIEKLLNRNIDIENEGTENEIKNEMRVKSK